MKPLVVTILPTRKCNLRCSYCKIRCRDFPNELNWEQWLECLKKVNKQFDSICFNVLLGGEITTWGDDLVRFVKGMKEANISYAFTTNGMVLMEDYLRELKRAGLDSISLSLDTLKMRGDSYENLKSSRTRRLLPLLNDLGFEDLHCTITVDNTNLEELPAMIVFLTNYKTYAEITPMHFSKDENYDYTGSYEDLKDRLFTEKDKDGIDQMMKAVVYMKKQGFLIHNTDNYLLNWSKFGIKQQWRCGYPVNLVADADGKMRLCLHIRGERVTKHNLKDLNFEKFLQDWFKDYEEYCLGCFWNCVYEAKYVYEKTGSIESVRDYFNHNVEEAEKLIKEQ